MVSTGSLTSGAQPRGWVDVQRRKAHVKSLAPNPSLRDVLYAGVLVLVTDLGATLGVILGGLAFGATGATTTGVVASVVIATVTFWFLFLRRWSWHDLGFRPGRHELAARRRSAFTNQTGDRAELDAGPGPERADCTGPRSSLPPNPARLAAATLADPCGCNHHGGGLCSSTPGCSIDPVQPDLGCGVDGIQTLVRKPLGTGDHELSGQRISSGCRAVLHLMTAHEPT